MGLFKRAKRGPIVSIEAGEMKSPAIIAAAPGIELRAVAGEGKQMTYEQRFEPGAGGLHMDVRFLRPALSAQLRSKATSHHRIRDRNHSPQQCLRLAEVSDR